jgi:hypothetical protein
MPPDPRSVEHVIPSDSREIPARELLGDFRGVSRFRSGRRKFMPFTLDRLYPAPGAKGIEDRAMIGRSLLVRTGYVRW